jgi:sec-independent protein translocase protein TatA
MPIGTWELVVIFLAVLLLFGGKKIPEVARGLGKGIREFKRAASDIQRELDLHRLDDNITKTPQPDISNESESISTEESSSKDTSAASIPDKPVNYIHDPGPEVESEEAKKPVEESRTPPTQSSDQQISKI